MPFCPKCHYEYEVGLLMCPDCREALVDHPVPAGTAAVIPDDSWVVVGGVATEIESHRAKGSLDSNNIPSLMMPSSFSRHGRLAGVGSAPRRHPEITEMIMVPREFLHEAVVVLSSVLGDDFDQVGTEDNGR